jgi:hypothetical protein
MPYIAETNTFTPDLVFVDDRFVGNRVTRADLDASVTDLGNGIEAVGAIAAAARAELIAVQEDIAAVDAAAAISTANAALTEADRTQTGLDRVQTGLDRTQTGLDRVQTTADVQAVEALLLTAPRAFDSLPALQADAYITLANTPSTKAIEAKETGGYAVLGTDQAWRKRLPTAHRRDDCGAS